MTPDFPQSDREQLEAKLTALLLGELPPHEEAALHRAMDEDPNLAELYDRLKHTIDLVCESATSPATETAPQPAPLKLSTERREKLLAHFKTIAPKEFVKPPRKRVPVLEMLVGVAAVAILAAMLLPALSTAKNKSRGAAAKSTIINNLRLVDGAKQTWALEANASGNATPQVAQVAPYLGRGGQANTDFPGIAGETYIPGKVSESPAVEMTVAQATKMFGRDIVARGEQHDGQVRLSLNNLLGEPHPDSSSDVGGRLAANDTVRYQIANAKLLAEGESKIVAQDASVSKEAISQGTVTANGAQNQLQPGAAYSFDPTTGQPIAPPPTPARTQIILPASNEAGNAQVAMSFTPATTAWTTDTHNEVGNITSADGSVQQGSIAQVRQQLQPSAGPVVLPVANFIADTPPSIATNHQFATNDFFANLGALRRTAGETIPIQYAQASDISKALANLNGNGNQVLTTNFTGNPEWIGALEQPPNELHDTNNQFVSRFASVVTPELAERDSTSTTYNPAGSVGNANITADPANHNIIIVADANTTEQLRESLKNIDRATLNQKQELQIAGAGNISGSAVGHGNIVLPPGQIAASANNQQLAWNSYDGITNSPNYFGAGATKADGFNLNGTDLAFNGTAEAQTNSVTMLGDLPNVGKLFRSESKAEDKTGFSVVNANPQESPLVFRETQNASTPQTPQFSGGFGGGGGGGFGGGFAGATNDQSFADRVRSLKQPASTGGKQVELASRFQSVTNRAVGFEWYQGNPSGTFPGVAAGGGTSSNVISANVIGYGNVANADTRTSGLPAQPTQLAAAKQELDSDKRSLQVLKMKTLEESVNKELPAARMVTIINPATPETAGKSTLGEKFRRALSGKTESTARITVEQERTDIAAMEGGRAAGQGYDPYFLQTEFAVIQSDAVLKKAAEKLNSDRIGNTPDVTVAQLKKALDVHPEKNSKVIDIEAKSETGKDAARIANAIADAYREYRSQQYEDIKSRGITSLQEQLGEQGKKVQLAQVNVDELRGKLGISDANENATGSAPSLDYTTLDRLSVAKVQREADYQQKATLLASLKSMNQETLRKAVPIEVTDNQLKSLLIELDQAQQQLLKLKTDYAQDHPKYQSAKELVDNLSHKVDDRVDGIMAGLQTIVNADKASMDAIQAQIDVEKQTELQQAKEMAPYYAAKQKLEAEQRRQLLLAQQAATNNQADAALPKPAIPPPTPQPEVLTSSKAFSTFSLNVSDVSFKLAAAALEKGQMPEPASIRSEEFINAFDYRDPEAAPGTPVAFNYDRALYPFAHNRELLRFSLKTAAAGRQAGRPLNIVLLLDNSGSMERADRVNIIREALRVLAAQLQPQDTFSIVTFARTARLRVDGIPGNQAAAAAEEIAKLTPEGGTDLGEALDVAYETALHHYLANGDNRVILLTDGAANLGDVDSDSLKRKVEAQRKQGISLDCFGIGWEDYNDDLLEVLTRDGDGRYGFINTPEEASTEFVTQIAGALHVAAQDVKVQVEFNPNRVTSYRQIGYAKHQLTKEQFRDNTVAAAQIAAQEAGNALYTIEINPQGEGSIGTVRVRYKVPGTSDYREQAWDVPYTGSALPLDHASSAMRLAATASAFSEWLATSPFADEVTTDQLLNYLNGIPQVYGADTRPQKLEWMIRQAKSISGK